MALVQNYYSSSESEADVEDLVEVSDSAKVTMKRKYHFTKAELKKRKQARSGDGPWSSWSDEDDTKTDTKHTNEDSETSNFTEHNNQDQDDSEDNTNTESSNFYGKSLTDYQGRSFLHAPVDIETDLTKEPLSFKTYLPKKIVHTFEGHTNGTTCLKFLPKTGHLFLTGGNDDKIKLWNFYDDRICVRDYMGHNKAIKSLNFEESGTRFISSSFDQTVKIWDTEVGKVSKKLKLKSFANCVEFRPFHPNEFIVGLSDSRILHYDDRVSEKEGWVQTYDHHLSSILAVRYFPDGSKFISSSEDKTVRIWDNQINIPIKQISDTAQHSMPVINIHPQKKSFCTQSLDNSIYTYDMKPKYKKHPNKIFRGQKSVGYSIGFTFSPDGHYLCSGDSNSKVILWDWTTTKFLKEIRIPGKLPITNVEWHPQETSKILATGPVGKIYLLD